MAAVVFVYSDERNEKDECGVDRIRLLPGAIVLTDG
jgi:hypothetical protein